MFRCIKTMTMLLVLMSISYTAQLDLRVKAKLITPVNVELSLEENNDRVKDTEPGKIATRSIRVDFKGASLLATSPSVVFKVDHNVELSNGKDKAILTTRITGIRGEVNVNQGLIENRMPLLKESDNGFTVDGVLDLKDFKTKGVYSGTVNVQVDYN